MSFGRGHTVLQRLRGLRRDGKGIIALEGALVGIPMVVLIVGTIFSGLNLTALTSLDSATRNAARNIRVAITKDATDANVRQTICSYVNTFTACGDILIYVQNGASFAALPPPPIVGSTMQTGFNPGASGNYVLMRVAMKSTLALGIAGMDGQMFSSTLVFRNE